MRSYKVSSLHILCMLSLSGLALAPRPSPALSTREIFVSVVSMDGSDQELTDAVTETLLTDLARSPHLSVTDGRGASGSDGAPYRIVGRCLTLDSHLIVSVRVVAATTGRSVPGIAEIVMGRRDDILSLVDRLANRISTDLVERAARTAVRRSPVVSSRHVDVALLRRAMPSLRVHPDMLRALPLQPSEILPRTAAQADPDASTAADAEGVGTREDHTDPVRERAYTGLIIDARGLEIKRSMSPCLRRANGSIVWAGEDANTDFAIEQGIVAYARRMSDAVEHLRAGAHPLVIRAIGRHADLFGSDPILADADADSLLEHNRADGFLKRFCVVLLVD